METEVTSPRREDGRKDSLRQKRWDMAVNHNTKRDRTLIRIDQVGSNLSEKRSTNKSHSHCRWEQIILSSIFFCCHQTSVKSSGKVYHLPSGPDGRQWGIMFGFRGLKAASRMMDLKISALPQTHNDGTSDGSFHFAVYFKKSRK